VIAHRLTILQPLNEPIDGHGRLAEPLGYLGSLDALPVKLHHLLPCAEGRVLLHGTLPRIVRGCVEDGLEILLKLTEGLKDLTEWPVRIEVQQVVLRDGLAVQ